MAAEALIRMLLIIQLVACAWMTGLIWIIQLLHYPMFKAISEDHFQDWMNFHTKTITPIVGFPMLIEAGTGLALLYWPSSKLPEFWAFINIGLIAVSFMATAAFSVPAHRHLALKGKDSRVLQKLVSSNWIRTIACTVRLILLLYCVLYKKSLKGSF